MTTIQDINSTIMFGSLTNDQLESVIAAIKFARTQRIKQAKNTFRPGDTVEFFNGKTGRTMVGQVLKINRKNIVVETSPISRWLVPANLLVSHGA